ncbi:unnamed protein product [Lactuca saligna]|uniref:Uncharacterized protein n=1 Tax=Lactuca saligna TaxID=75948 RepID=A0AA35YY73_LACSI|nr:unnamed protein product [Lactuca saligna]
MCKILLPREEKKSKRSKKNESGSSEKLVSETTTTKSSKKKPSEVKVVNEVFLDVSIPIEPDVKDTHEKVVISSKTSVFRRIKMKSNHPQKSASLNVVRKPHVTHQISKRETKKTRNLVMTIESTEDEDERIPETPKANLKKESSNPEQTMVIPAEDSSAKSSHEEARTSDINANVSHTDVNVNMDEGDLKTELKVMLILLFRYLHKSHQLLQP